jgi:hypothetical protein
MTPKKINELLEDCVVNYNAGENEMLMRIVLHDEQSDTPYQVMLACTDPLRACWQHDRYISREEAVQIIKDSWDCWKRTYTN